MKNGGKAKRTRRTSLCHGSELERTILDGHRALLLVRVIGEPPCARALLREVGCHGVRRRDLSLDDAWNRVASRKA